jgi:hypothetical protein
MTPREHAPPRARRCRDDIDAPFLSLLAALALIAQTIGPACAPSADRPAGAPAITQNVVIATIANASDQAKIINYRSLSIGRRLSLEEI